VDDSSRWPSGQGAGLAINGTPVQIPAAALSSATLGKFIYTHTHTCSSATKQYEFGTGGNWEYNRRSGFALCEPPCLWFTDTVV